MTGSRHELQLERIHVVAADDEVCSCELDGGAIILHLPSGQPYALNTVGTRVWHLLQAPTSAAAIYAALLAEFEVDPPRCRMDLISILEHLHERGLIRVTRRQED